MEMREEWLSYFDYVDIEVGGLMDRWESMEGFERVGDTRLRLIKGAGGALAREKVVASAAELFVCIVDESKLVERLGDPAGGHEGVQGGSMACPSPRAALAAAFVADMARAWRKSHRPAGLPQR
jgi:hypothetical protein